MRKYTQHELRRLVANGMAIDATNFTSADVAALHDGPFEQVGYAAISVGCGGQLWQSKESGQLYAITKRTGAIYSF